MRTTLAAALLRLTAEQGSGATSREARLAADERTGPSEVWRWVRIPLGIAIASRLLSVGILATWWAVGGFVQPNPAAAHGENFLAVWDSPWYLHVAATGYHATTYFGGLDFAFFPVWPMLIRVASLGILPLAPVAAILANVIAIAATVMVWRLFDVRFGPRIATSATALLAFSPPAFVLSMAYAEPLLLLLAAAAFLPRSGPARGIIAMAAALTRISGLALIPAGLATLMPRQINARRALWMAAGAALGFAAWWIFVALLTGNPAGYLTGSAAWIHSSPIAALSAELRGHPIRLLAWGLFVLAMWIGSILAFLRDRELGAYALAAMAIGIIPTLFGGFTHSGPRYALVAFPAFAGLATRVGPRATAITVAVFVIGQVAFAAWTVGTGSQAP